MPERPPLLLSIDWDAFSGTRELVFDAPIWGTRDREEDRLKAWRERVRKRGGQGWEGLAADFPLYPGWEALERYAGVPTHVTLTHADAWEWLAASPGAYGRVSATEPSIRIWYMYVRREHQNRILG